MPNPKEAFILKSIAAMQPTFSAPPQPGITGRLETDTDASENLDAPYSWVRIGDSRAASPCVNNLFARNAVGIPVWTAIRHATQEREIISVRSGATSSLPPSVIEKIINPGKQPIESADLTMGRVEPAASTGTDIYIRAFNNNADGWIGGRHALATEIGALSSGASAMLIVGENESTGAISVTVGAEKSLAYTFARADANDISVTAGVIKLWALVIKDGQANIIDCWNTVNRQFDLRPFLTLGTGAEVFTDLTDVPSDYTGHAEKLVRVNTGATALEFISPSGIVGDCVLLFGGELGSDASVITLNSIPSTYKHLLLIVAARSKVAATTDSLLVTVNNDSTAGNYFGTHFGFTNTTSAAAQNNGATATIALTFMPGDSATANLFGGLDLKLFDYADAAHLKLATWNSAWSTGLTSGGMSSRMGQGQWNSGSAITRIDISAAGGDLAAGTRYALYGLN